MRVTDPDESGGADYATDVLHNPWDMAGPPDVVATSSVTAASYSGGFFHAFNSSGDAALVLLNPTNNGTPIDSRRYRYLTFDLQVRVGAGAYIAGLEDAANTKATICGKPEKAYFDSALAMLGVTADRAAMVGDDIVNDILGAQVAGLTGILVRTGKYRAGDEDRDDGRPDHVVPSFADVPELLGSP